MLSRTARSIGQVSRETEWRRFSTAVTHSLWIARLSPVTITRMTPKRTACRYAPDLRTGARPMPTLAVSRETALPSQSPLIGTPQVPARAVSHETALLGERLAGAHSSLRIGTLPGQGWPGP